MCPATCGRTEFCARRCQGESVLRAIWRRPRSPGAAHDRAGGGSRQLGIDKIPESTELERSIAAGRDDVGSHERVELFAIVIAGGASGKFAGGRMNIYFVEAVR